MKRWAVIVLAAGRSSRFGDPNYKKPLAMLGGRAVWLHSVERFAARADVLRTLVVLAAEDRADFVRKYGANLMFLDAELVEGGAERADSVRAALARVPSQVTHVAVHDAARPLVTDREIDAVFAAALEHGAAILAAPVTATLKRVAEGRVTETVPREGLWGAQTPQAFDLTLLRRAHATGADATDDAGLVERLGERVAVVEGSAENLKITTRDDLRLAEAILASRVRKPPTGVSLWREADDEEEN